MTQKKEQLLSKLGVVDGAELSNQGSIDMVINDYVLQTLLPMSYEDMSSFVA